MDRIGDWMQSASGRAVFPLDPRPDEIEIDDIAHALSRQCRYGGHILAEWYSVAEHCYILSHAVPQEHAFSALMHDAAETYLQDIVRPVKKSLDGYLEIEEGLERVIFKKF